MHAHAHTCTRTHMHAPRLTAQLRVAIRARPMAIRHGAESLSPHATHNYALELRFVSASIVMTHLYRFRVYALREFPLRSVYSCSHHFIHAKAGQASRSQPAGWPRVWGVRVYGRDYSIVQKRYFESSTCNYGMVSINHHDLSFHRPDPIGICSARCSWSRRISDTSTPRR